MSPGSKMTKAGGHAFEGRHGSEDHAEYQLDPCTRALLLSVCIFQKLYRE